MARRFEETVGIGSQNLSTGFVQGSNTLLNRLQGFKQATETLIDVAETKRGQEEAQQAIAEGKPFKKKESSLVEQVLTGGTATAQYNKSIETAYLAGLSNDAKEALNAIEAENPDNITQFNEKAQGYINGVLKEVDQSVLPQVSQFLDSQLTNARMRVHNKTIAKNKADADAESKVAVDSFGNEAARLAREGNQEGAAEQILLAFEGLDALVESGAIDVNQASMKKREIEREASEQTRRKGYDDIFETEGAARAFEQLEEDSGNVPKGWTPDEWDSFIASSQADLRQKVIRKGQIDAQKEVADSIEVSELKIKGSTGFDSKGNPIEPGDIIAQANKLFADGTINGSTRASVITSTINRQKKEVENIVDTQKVAQKLAGAIEIPLTQKEVDTAWEKDYAPAADKLPTDVKNASIAQFVNSTKITPTAVKRQVNNDLNSGDVELVSNAADLMVRLDTLRGVPDNNFSPNDRAFADAVVNLSVNMDPVEAIKLAEKTTNPNDTARIEARKSQLKEQQSGVLATSYREVVEENFDPWFGSTTVDSISGEKLAKEYGDLFEQHFIAGMSKDKAKETALTIIERNWKDSEAVGKKRVMKYPPEDYYQVSGDIKYVGRQLMSDLSTQAIGLPEYTKEDVVLMSDDRTAREATNGRPSYLVGINTDDGFVPVVGFRFVPDMQKEVKRQKEANKQMLEEERKQLKKQQVDLQEIDKFVVGGSF